jgi:hypothetical protein
MTTLTPTRFCDDPYPAVAELHAHPNHPAEPGRGGHGLATA